MQIDAEVNNRYQDLITDMTELNLQNEAENLSTVNSELTEKTLAADFWSNVEQAQEISSKLGKIEKALVVVEKLRNSLADLEFMYDEIKGGAKEYYQDFVTELGKLETRLAKYKVKRYLSGKYDENPAIFSIFAGQGGTEANDWAEMLMRMYMRYFEKKGWKYEILNKSEGNEAGISTVTFKVVGDYAYGYLKVEHGTHRLVRISPFNAQGLRQTSFAGVEVTPVVEKADDLEIKDEDIEFAAVRSSGAGGQNVNKVATSVRIRHIPTQIVVTSSSQRSQLQNRALAMEMLRSKLAKMEEDKMRKEIADESGDHFKASWGNQIRNYVLHPYKLVKDLRTRVETDNTDAVLDGGLDMFIDPAIVFVAESS